MAIGSVDNEYRENEDRRPKTSKTKTSKMKTSKRKTSKTKTHSKKRTIKINSNVIFEELVLSSYMSRAGSFSRDPGTS